MAEGAAQPIVENGGKAVRGRGGGSRRYDDPNCGTSVSGGAAVAVVTAAGGGGQGGDETGNGPVGGGCCIWPLALCGG